MIQQKVVLVPGWLEQAVVSANQPLAVVLDVVQLSNIVSKDDVAFYIDVNRRLFGKLFPGIQESFNWSSLWPRANGDEKINDLCEYLNGKMQKFSEDMPEIPFSYALHLISVSESPEQLEKMKSASNYAFELYPLTEDTFGLRALLKNDQATSFEQDLLCHSNAIELLSNTVPFETLAATQMFKTYARLCKNKIKDV